MSHPGDRSRSCARRSVVAAVALLAVLASLLVGCRPSDGRDIGVTVGGAPDWLAPGEQRSFTVTVTNHGTSPATGSEANVFTSVELGATGSSAFGPCDHLAEGVLALVSCPLGTLAPGASATATFTLAGGPAPGTYAVEVGGGSDTPDPDPDPHVDAATLTVHVGTGGVVDLQVTGARLPAQSGIGEPFTERTVIANRGPSAASQVSASLEFPTTVPATTATLRRADGLAEGTCTLSPGLATCSTGPELVEPLHQADDQWFLDVTLVPSNGYAFFVTHAASSPHPEAAPDQWPNSVTRTEYVSSSGGLAFNPVAPVPVGQEVEILGVWTGGSLHYAQYVSVYLPAGFEIIQVVVSGQPTACGTGAPSNQCTAALSYPDGSTISIRARAIDPTRPGQGGVTFSSEGGGASGTFALQAVDPTITSEIHPEVTAPTDGVVGQVATVTAIARNTGAVDHASVTVAIATPGAQLAFARWGAIRLPCTTAAHTATCALGTVEAYGAVSLEIGVIASSPGTQSIEVSVTSSTPQMQPDPGPDTSVVSFPVLAATVDLGAAVTVSPTPPTEGAPLTLIVDVTNHGTLTSPSATLTATLPASLPVTSVTAVFPLSPGGAACATAAQVVTCPLGTLARGRTQQIRIVTSVPDAVGGVVSFDLTSGAAEPTPDPHPNHVDEAITVSAPAADLTGTLKTWPTFVSGQAYEIEGRAFNYGPSAVTDAVATIQLPTDWTVTSAVTDSGTACTSVPGTVTCPIGTLGSSGGNLRLYIDVVAGGPITDTGASITVTSSLPDPGPRPSTVSYPFDVLAQEVDLGLYTSTPEIVAAGADDVVSIRFDNAGPATATGAVLTATFPADVAIVSTRVRNATGGACNTSGQVVTCTVPNVYPGADPRYAPRAEVTVRHLSFGSPSSYQVTVTSDQAERDDQTLPNAVTIVRTPVPGDAQLRVWGRDQLGNPRRVTVKAYRPTDGFAPTYTAEAWVYDGWASLALASGYEYRLAISSPGCTTTWWEGAASRPTATPLVAAGFSEVWDLHAVLSC